MDSIFSNNAKPVKPYLLGTRRLNKCFMYTALELYNSIYKRQASSIYKYSFGVFL